MVFCWIILVSVGPTYKGQVVVHKVRQVGTVGHQACAQAEVHIAEAKSHTLKIYWMFNKLEVDGNNGESVTV